MGKVTDRILWSVLVLAIGIGMFVFGKPALSNLTNQVLHHDDLKATMQSPSLSSLDVYRINAVNNDVGVSKHAYILASTSGISDDDLWCGVQRQIYFPDEIRKTPIPYNSYVKVIFKVKVDKPVRMMMDVSDQPATGSDWNNNDDDEVSRRQLIVDGKTTSIGIGSNQTLLSANTWHTIEVEYENTDIANTQHVALFDDSAIDFINNNSDNVNVQTKDFVFAVDNIKYR